MYYSDIIYSTPQQWEVTPDRTKLESMNTRFKLSNPQVYSFSLILAAIILLIDLSLPLGVAGGVLYIAVILISLWSSRNRFSLYLAAGCSILVAIGFLYSPPGGEFWKVMVNRGLALFAIWVTAILLMVWKETRKNNLELKLTREVEKEKIYVATIHGTQHIVNNLLNQLLLIKMEAENQKGLDSETIKILDDMATEAASLTKSLSEVDEIDDEKIRQSVYPQSDQQAGKGR